MLRRERRPDRPESARRRPPVGIDILERRELLAADPLRYYHFIVRPPAIGPGRGDLGTTTAPPARTTQAQLQGLDNEGKVVSGKDRQGDEYIIRVHGPGAVIVTDATPNDGVLDDDLDTIQIVGSDIHETVVTGQVIGSARTPSDGTLLFNKIIARGGVRTIRLNGFTLSQTVAPDAGNANFSDTGIFLPGGVQHLQFHDIQGVFATNNDDAPIRIVVGNPTTPLRVPTSIRFDSIFNTAVDASVATQPAATPQTSPTVSIEVNGILRRLDYVSSTAQPINAGDQANFPTVSITGRTSVRALEIGDIRVAGTTRNTTFSRGPVTRRSFVGLRRLHSARFGGNADAVAIYSEGRIGRLTFQRGLGSPVGVSRAGTALGTPVADFGYPANGLSGGVIVASEIGSLHAAPADVQLQTSTDPDLIQLLETNATTYYPRLGSALITAAIVTSGSIGEASILGSSINTEVKTGFHYQSYVAGLEGTRAPSQIGHLDQEGDLIDSVNSATYRAVDGIYGNGNDRAGRGSIRGRQVGFLYLNGSQTALRNLGTGNFARRKVGDLPPPEGPRRVRGVLRRV